MREREESSWEGCASGGSSGSPVRHQRRRQRRRQRRLRTWMMLGRRLGAPAAGPAGRSGYSSPSGSTLAAARATRASKTTGRIIAGVRNACQGPKRAWLSADHCWQLSHNAMAPVWGAPLCHLCLQMAAAAAWRCAAGRMHPWLLANNPAKHSVATTFGQGMELCRRQVKLALLPGPSPCTWQQGAAAPNKRAASSTQHCVLGKVSLPLATMQPRAVVHRACRHSCSVSIP